MSGLLSVQGKEKLLSPELKDGKLQFRKGGGRVWRGGGGVRGDSNHGE